VEFTIHVNKLPGNPEAGTPGTTHPLSRVDLHGLSTSLFGRAAGSAAIAIASGPASAPPTSAINQVPTLSELAMILLVGFIVLVGALTVRKRRTT